MDLTVVLQTGDSHAVPILLDRVGNVMTGKETGARLQRIADGLRRLPQSRFRRPDVSSEQLWATLHAIHNKAYLDFLSHHNDTLKAGDLLIDHPFIQPGVDPDTPLIAGIYTVALEAAKTAIDAAQQVVRGATTVYALCRPPGHHAGSAWMGGYCYLNNAVAAVHTLLSSGVTPVGLIDFDFHFGNGSIDILDHEPNVMFGSVHSDTEINYPYLPTKAREGGWQVFIPFIEPPSTVEFLDAISTMVETAPRLGCKALVVSVGYDIIAGDPHGEWELPVSILEEIGMLLAGAEVPLCFVQEGGYFLDKLEECAFRLGQGVLKNR